MNLLPSTAFASEKNAARMVLFAEAAYFDNEIRHASARSRFQNNLPAGKSVWWNHQDAAGVIYADNDCICVGAASTPAAGIATKSSGSVEQRVCEWSERTGIPVPNDARDVGTTADLLGYATRLYMGIETALHEHFRLTLAEMSKPMWIAGHSLGGAAIQVLQCTTMFTHARAYVYGSPKVFLKHTLPPERLRVSIRRLADYATYLPHDLQHASAEMFYVTHPGSLRRTISWESRPIALAYSVRAWLSGSSCLGASGFQQSDGVRQYQRDLWPLR